MDDLLPLLLSFPPHPPPPHPLSDDEYDRQIRGLLQVLNQTPGNRLTGKIAGGGDLLDVSLPEHKLFFKSSSQLQITLHTGG